MASVTNVNGTIVDQNGLGSRTTVINIAKTNITKVEMLTMVQALGAAGHTVAGVNGMQAALLFDDDTVDNVQVILQGGVTYVANATNALGVTGAATTILAGPFDQTPA